MSGSVFLARRGGGDSERSLARLTCLEVATRKQGGTGSRRVVQGGRKGASCTDHHSEQPVTWQEQRPPNLCVPWRPLTMSAEQEKLKQMKADEVSGLTFVVQSLIKMGDD